MNRISRFISLLLVTALLSLCLSGAFAETATETEESYAVLRKLLETFDENPPENQVFEDAEAAAEYCAKLYGFIDPAKVGGIFYGGEEEAAGFLLTLHDTLLADYGYSDASLQTTEMFYAFVWELLHMDSAIQNKSRPAVKGTVKDVFEGITEDGMYAATDLCYEYIGTYEPDIAGSAYTMNTDNERTVNGSEEYFQYYTEGYQLFEEGKYAEAVESYKKCLEFQENDPLATFEIIEAYIAMRDYESAKSWLAQIAPYLEGNEYKAQWFRRQGYIAIEEMDYQLAYAFYAYSLTFEQSEMAESEMEYIKYVSPDVQPFTEEEAKTYLEERGMITDLWEQACQAQKETVPQVLKIAEQVLNSENEPEVELGDTCHKCPFFRWCIRNLPCPNLFDIHGMQMRTKLKHYRNGLVTFEDMEKAGVVKNANQQRQISYELRDLGTYTEPGKIRDFLSGLSFPLYFLDFETMQTAIPLYVGTHPFAQIPFQYSLHYVEKEGGEVMHKEFLAESGMDPRRDIAESLCLNIPADACVTAYHKDFECTRLKELAEYFPDLGEHLLGIRDHIVDLEVPFKNGLYYTRAMGGRSSIKSVLPAICPNDPELDYHELEGVHNGTEAMSVYPEIQYMPPEEQEKARRNLLAYCRLDTLAMVKVWEELKRAAEC